VQNELAYRNFFKRVLNVVLLSGVFFVKVVTYYVLIHILVIPL